MKTIGTKGEAYEEASRILEALKKMPEGPERNDYLGTVKRLNAEYGLGLEELIPDSEEKSDEGNESEELDSSSEDKTEGKGKPEPDPENPLAGVPTKKLLIELWRRAKSVKVTV